MTFDEFKKIDVGDVIRHEVTGQAYTVVQRTELMPGQFCLEHPLILTVLRVMTATNCLQWEHVARCVPVVEREQVEK